MMKLYMHPVSTVCRPIRLLCAENGIQLDEEMVDLMTGAQHKEPFASLNPNRQVPVLVDGDLRLTEGSAILKYIADKHHLPSYPADLKKRAKVNEIMDWLNTGFYRDFGYNLVYPQLFPHAKRRSDEAHAGTIEWGKERTKFWLKILDQHLLGSGQKCLCGDDITIADYLGAGMVSLTELIQCDLGQYPNLCRWYTAMKARPNWAKVNEVFNGFVGAMKGKEFEAV